MSLPLPGYFNDFLKNIRLSGNEVNELKSAHETLRQRLSDDDDLSPIIIDTFLQGSYKRSTAVKPRNGNKSDVDIIIVTNLDKTKITPEEALNKFEPFLKKYYNGKYRKQGRSWGIEMSHVDLDVVPTSAPSEVEMKSVLNKFVKSSFTVESVVSSFYDSNLSPIEKHAILEASTNFQKSASNTAWKIEPLNIPDREAQKWDETHPLEQIRWTVDKNLNCNGYFVNVVKAIKWWRKVKYPEIKHPKSYPLEHFIGNCCPDGIDSVAEGITLSLEKIIKSYPLKPFLSDRGVPKHDVFARISNEDYKLFYESVKVVAKLARQAFDETDVTKAANIWREIFGSEFPEPPKESSKTNFSPRSEDSGSLSGGRFA